MTLQDMHVKKLQRLGHFDEGGRDFGGQKLAYGLKLQLQDADLYALCNAKMQLHKVCIWDRACCENMKKSDRLV